GSRANLIHEAKSQRVRSIDFFTEKNKIQSFRFTDYFRHSLYAAPTGGNAKIKFRTSYLGFRIVSHVTKMAGHCQFTTAAKGVSVYSGDERFGRTFDSVINVIAVGSFVNIC